MTHDWNDEQTVHTFTKKRRPVNVQEEGAVVVPRHSSVIRAAEWRGQPMAVEAAVMNGSISVIEHPIVETTPMRRVTM
jgi:hypothetical protein